MMKQWQSTEYWGMRYGLDERNTWIMGWPMKPSAKMQAAQTRRREREAAAKGANDAN